MWPKVSMSKWDVSFRYYNSLSSQFIESLCVGIILVGGVNGKNSRRCADYISRGFPSWWTELAIFKPSCQRSPMKEMPHHQGCRNKVAHSTSWDSDMTNSRMNHSFPESKSTIKVSICPIVAFRWQEWIRTATSLPVRGWNLAGKPLPRGIDLAIIACRNTWNPWRTQLWFTTVK